VTSSLLMSASVHAVTNGDFEQIPNNAWMMDGPNVPRRVQGDRPGISVAPNGNHYAHIGDRDGIPAHGETPSRIFQLTDCADSTSIGRNCVVSFRFRALLLQGDFAWVRMRSPNGLTIHAIPHSNNQWANVRMQVVLEDACLAPQILIEFGLLNRQGRAIGGRLNIDDVRHRCDDVAVPQPEADDWDFLPPLPDPDRAEPIIPDAPLMMTGSGNIGLSLLLLAGIVMLILKLRSRNRT
jgi:hypothetical protein